MSRSYQVAKSRPDGEYHGTMPARAHVSAAALAAAALLAGCGSTTKTVSASGPPAGSANTTADTPSQPSPSAAGATATTGTTASAPAASGPSSGGTEAPGTSTRTAPEPAFSEHEAAAEGTAAAAAAAAVVQAHGYTPDETSQYHPDQTLRVLVGTRTGSADGYDQLAFFFVDGRYIGTDAKEPSASVKVVSQGDTEVALAYPLYRPKDPLSSPGGGQATVRFQLDNGSLVALDPIPPAHSASGLSRN